MAKLKRVLLVGLIAFISATSPLRTTSQRTPPDNCKFCGVWKAVGKERIAYCSCDYLKITKAAVGKFKLSTAFEYPEGNIQWTQPEIKNADGIYSIPINGKLVGRFISPNFYATHAMYFSFKITCELTRDNELIFSVWSLNPREGKRWWLNKGTYSKISD